MAQIAVNDLSFYTACTSTEREKEAVRNFYKAFSELHDPKYHNVDKIYGNYPKEIQDFSLKGKLDSYLSHEEVRLLLSLLNKLSYVPDGECSVRVNGIDYSSSVCGWAKNGIVISIGFWDLFLKNTFEGIDSSGNIVLIKNIAIQEHLEKYEYELGRRKYEPSRKHRRQKYQRSGGTEVSPMDLSDEMAQKFLDRAVKLNKGKKLYYYDKETDKYYVFQCTRGNIYHGFQQDSLSREECTKIRKQCC